MRMEDLRYLIQVAESGSISQAAETCYITQQGLSRIISSLEKELGVALFHRSSNHIRLTDMGEIVVARAVSWMRSTSGCSTTSAGTACSRLVSRQ